MQVGTDLFAISDAKLQVTKFANMVNKLRNVEAEAMACLNKQRQYHTSSAYEDQAIYVIGGLVQDALLSESKANVYRFDI